ASCRLSFWGDLISAHVGQRSKAKPKTCFSRLPIYLLVRKVHLLCRCSKCGLIAIFAYFLSFSALRQREITSLFSFGPLSLFRSKITLDRLADRAQRDKRMDFPNLPGACR